VTRTGCAIKRAFVESLKRKPNTVPYKKTVYQGYLVKRQLL